MKASLEHETMWLVHIKILLGVVDLVLEEMEMSWKFWKVLSGTLPLGYCMYATVSRARIRYKEPPELKHTGMMGLRFFLDRTRNFRSLEIALSRYF